MPLLVEHLSRLEREKEKWRVVVNRRHVIAVTIREAIGIIARDQIAKWILLSLRRQIKRMQMVILRKMSSHRRLLFHGKRILLGQHHDWNSVLIQPPLRSHNKISCRIRDSQT